MKRMDTGVRVLLFNLFSIPLVTLGAIILINSGYYRPNFFHPKWLVLSLNILIFYVSLYLFYKNRQELGLGTSIKRSQPTDNQVDDILITSSKPRVGKITEPSS